LWRRRASIAYVVARPTIGTTNIKNVMRAWIVTLSFGGEKLGWRQKLHPLENKLKLLSWVER
jgi:hypothetical protein